MAVTYKAQFRHNGDAIDYTPDAAVSAGDVVVLTDKIGIAIKDIAASAKGALAVEGVFRVAKENVAFAAGADVYWDETNELAIASGGVYMGWAVAAAATDDDTVDVRLQQQESTVSSTETGSGTGG